MRKIILDFNHLTSGEEIQSYLARKLDFPDYYGMNLDALYDCLTDIGEYTCIGIFLPGDSGDESGRYLDRVVRVFLDAESENRRLGVIVAGRTTEEDGYEEEDDYVAEADCATEADYVAETCCAAEDDCGDLNGYREAYGTEDDYGYGEEN